MKVLFTLVLTVIISLNSMAQNKHPMKIGMVSIFVEDPAKAFKYYTEVLGFEEYMFDPENHLAIVNSSADKGGVTLLLEPVGPWLPIALEYKNKLYEMGMPVISFSSDDIQKTVEELKAKGVKFKKEPVKTDFGWEAVFDDNNGNFIQLYQL